MTTVNPSISELLKAIAHAGTGAELRRIAQEHIRPARGFSEPERRELQMAVNRRFSALNAAALKGTGKPRWAGQNTPPIQAPP